jgi:hypothetical protein
VRWQAVALRFIRDDPLYPRHQRSIDTFFTANINCWPAYAIETRYIFPLWLRWQSFFPDICRSGFAKVVVTPVERVQVIQQPSDKMGVVEFIH